MRRTKIVATMGPAVDRPEIYDALVDAGMDAARLNSSHADLPALQRTYVSVRAAAERADRHVAVLVDLAGPKLRLGEVAADSALAVGETFELSGAECVGTSQGACVDHPAISEEVSAGDRVFLDDGRIELVVRNVSGGSVLAEVIAGGSLRSRMGVNVPAAALGVEPVTEADRAVLEWARGVGVDWLAQSFVRGPEDVDALREVIGDSGIPIMAKIEKREAVGCIDEIVAAADGVMVARGDLGVETSPERVPVLQQRIVRAGRAAGKPVVVATQMLESMVSTPRPTRAEASDVATAIFQRADAIMLSAETAIGSYPVEAVSTAGRIARAAEEDLPPAGEVRSAGTEDDVQEALSAAVVDIAEDLRLSAIVTATRSGATARGVARHRPGTPIVAATPSEVVARRLAVVWGVTPRVVEMSGDTDAMLDAATEAAVLAGAGRPRERIAITSGRASAGEGGTDFILVRDMQ
jgi:pyruvate kinase